MTTQVFRIIVIVGALGGIIGGVFGNLIGLIAIAAGGGFMLLFLNSLAKIQGRKRWYRIPNWMPYSTISIWSAILFWNRITRSKTLTVEIEVNSSMVANFAEKQKWFGITTDTVHNNSFRVAVRGYGADLTILGAKKPIYVFAPIEYCYINGSRVEREFKKYSFSEGTTLKFYLKLRKSKVYRLNGTEDWYTHYILLDENNNIIFQNKLFHSKGNWKFLLPYYEEKNRPVNVRLTVV